MPPITVHWNGSVPYFRFGLRRYQCHQGADKNIHKKLKYAKFRDQRESIDPSSTKRYRKLQPSKKLGCPAKIQVIRVVRLPDYEIQGLPTSGKKSKVAAQLKKEILSCGSISGEAGYFFNIPETNEHKFHALGSAAGAVEPVDERVRKYIKDLVYQGQSNVVVISKLVHTYAVIELSQNDTMRRRYFPDLQTIRKFVSQAKQKLISDGAHVSTIPLDETETVSCESIADTYTDMVVEVEPHNITNCIADTYTDMVDEVEPHNNNNCIADTHISSLPLKPRKTKPRLLIKKCNSSIRAIQSVMRNLTDEHLLELSHNLDAILENISKKIVTDGGPGFPTEMSSSPSQPILRNLSHSSLNSVSGVRTVQEKKQKSKKKVVKPEKEKCIIYLP